MTYDLDWKPMPEVCVFDSRYREGKVMVKPQNLNEMLTVAECLAKPFPEVRLDLYNVNGKIYFGEITFFDSAGFGSFNPEKYDLVFGRMLKLPNG